MTVISRPGSVFAIWLGVCAMSPILPEAETLVGDWTITVNGSGESCAVRLTLRPLRNGHALETGRACVETLRLGGVAFWRVAPDGIALASESGRTLAFFSREGASYVLRRARCPTLVLTRAATRSVSGA